MDEYIQIKARYMLLHISSGRLCGRFQPSVYHDKNVWMSYLTSYKYIIYTECNTFLFAYSDDPNYPMLAIEEEFEIVEI